MRNVFCICVVWVGLAGLLAGCGEGAGGGGTEADAAAQARALTQRTYNRSCASCHISGVAKAPRTGDAEAWRALLEQKGMDALVSSVRNGYNAMPPMGMCPQCSDEEFRRLIEYMSAPRQN